MSHIFLRCSAPGCALELRRKGIAMLQESFDLMPLWAFVAACGVTMMAGFVKGAVGFAMPLVMISGLSLFLDPLVAVAGIVLPIVMSNLLQVLRFPLAEARAVLREFWRYILIVCLMIVVVAQFVTAIPTQTFYLVLGVPVVILSLIQLSGVAGNAGHSSKHITMSEPKSFCISIDRSGLSICFEPSIWLRNSTPSSVSLRSSAKLIT